MDSVKSPPVDVPKRDIKKASKALRKGGSRARPVAIIPTDVPIEGLLTSVEARRKAVDTLIACLDAERTYYDVFAKQMVTEPCHATRCNAAKILLAYDVGEPVKRQQIMIGKVDTDAEIMARLSANPLLRETIKSMVNAVEVAGEEVEE